jgi:hypothetical protein
LLGLRAVDRTLCVVPLSRAHGSETLALPTLLAAGRCSLKVAEVQIYGLAEHAICMNRHDGERTSDHSTSIVGQQARGERVRKDDVPRTDLADQ